MSPEQLHAYLDGELSPEEAAEVERRIAADPAVARQVRELRAVDAALEALPGMSASAGFKERVVAAAQGERASPPAGRLLRILAPIAAAAAILAGVLLSRPDGAPRDENGVFTQKEHLGYVWEDDAGTYGSLAPSDLEDDVLAALEAT